MHSTSIKRPLSTASATAFANRSTTIAPSGMSTAAGTWTKPPQPSTAGGAASPNAEFDVLADDMRWIDEALRDCEVGEQHVPLPRQGRSPEPMTHAVPARFLLAAETMGPWIEDALARQPVMGMSASGTAPLPLMPSATSAMSRLASARRSTDSLNLHAPASGGATARTATASGHTTSAATLPPRSSIARASDKRKYRLQCRAHREDRVHGGVFSAYVYNKRVSRESTDRLNRYKAQLDALGAGVVLSLGANFTLQDVRALLQAHGQVLETKLRSKSVMEGAHNFIFHAVCREQNRNYTRNATVDEVADHVSSIVALPAAERAKIKSYLDITRSLLATHGLASSFEAVKRAVRAFPSVKRLPVYA